MYCNCNPSVPPLVCGSRTASLKSPCIVSSELKPLSTRSYVHNAVQRLWPLPAKIDKQDSTDNLLRKHACHYDCSSQSINKDLLDADSSKNSIPEGGVCRSDDFNLQYVGRRSLVGHSLMFGFNCINFVNYLSVQQAQAETLRFEDRKLESDSQIRKPDEEGEQRQQLENGKIADVENELRSEGEGKPQAENLEETLQRQEDEEGFRRKEEQELKIKEDEELQRSEVEQEVQRKEEEEPQVLKEGELHRYDEQKELQEKEEEELQERKEDEEDQSKERVEELQGTQEDGQQKGKEEEEPQRSEDEEELQRRRQEEELQLQRQRQKEEEELQRREYEEELQRRRQEEELQRRKQEEELQRQKQEEELQRRKQEEELQRKNREEEEKQTRQLEWEEETTAELDDDKDGALFTDPAEKGRGAEKDGTELDSDASAGSETRTDEMLGFDGLGGDKDQYASAKVLTLAQSGEGAIVYLNVDGYDLPIRMLVGAAEAMAVLTAMQERESKRPVTHKAWTLTLAAVGWKVARVAITSLENDVYQSTVILSKLSKVKTMATAAGDPAAEYIKCVGVRPSDGIALALRSKAPLFVAKQVADTVLRSAIKKRVEKVEDYLDKRPGSPSPGGNGQVFVKNGVAAASPFEDVGRSYHNSYLLGMDEFLTL